MTTNKSKTVRFSKQALADYLRPIEDGEKQHNDFIRHDGDHQIQYEAFHYNTAHQQPSIRSAAADLIIKYDLPDAAVQELSDLLNALQDRALAYGRWELCKNVSSEFDLPLTSSKR